MFTTKHLVDDIKEIPIQWIFEYYLKLEEKLAGQHVKMHSVFNPTERTPSMCLYVDNATQMYKYKDFSTDKGGSAYDLVCHIYDITFREAVIKILDDYNAYVLSNGGAPIDTFKVRSRYKVTDYTTRGWNINDTNYWTKFKIGSTLLEKFNVKPLASYVLSKESEGKHIKIEGEFLYGYFSSKGDLYKVYQPLTKSHKFIKVKDHIQGIDQLKYDKPYLVICSSLKDAMCLTKLKYNVEVIVPDSENTMIKPHVIQNMKEKYDKIVILFDYDEAGIASAKKYEETYGTPYAILPMEKDLADSIKAHGIQKVNEKLVPLLREALALYKK